MILNQWIRGVLILVLAGFVAVGCAGNKQAPAEPPPEPEVAEPTPAPEAPEATPPSDFDGTNTPINPDTGRPLDSTFYFEYDKAGLSPSDLAVLEIHAVLLRRNPAKRVVIEGHCDERGTREYNLALGERRSDTVRSFLSSAGVSSSQLESVSYGEERPEDPGHDNSSWSRNRRAVLIYR